MTSGTIVRDASELAEEGAFEDAIALLEGHLSKGSCEEATIYETLAQCYLVTDRPVEAYHYAVEATQRDASWADAYVTRARAARNAGDVVEALRAFVRAAALDPNEATQEELEEAQQLRWAMVAKRIGIPDLQILEDDASGYGPGGVVWEAAFHLVDYLDSHFPTIQGKRVLEMGSGTGVVGIVCAIRGAHVTLTDQSQLFPLIQGNVDRNRHLMHRNQGSCQCQTLDWNRPGQGWKDVEWDFVVGADLVYAESQIKALVSLLQEIRNSLPRCLILLAHKCRNDAVDQKWFDQLKAIEILPIEKTSSTERTSFRILSSPQSIT